VERREEVRVEGGRREQKRVEQVERGGGGEIRKEKGRGS